MGAAGMTYEKGTSEIYGKQVYDHYLAIDTTINVTSNNKVGILTRLGQAVGRGASSRAQSCQLQENKLVSPLHDHDRAAAPGTDVCGYFFKPGPAHR